MWIFQAPLTELHWHGIAALMIGMVGFNLSNAADSAAMAAGAGPNNVALGILFAILATLCATAMTIGLEAVTKGERFDIIPFTTKNLWAAGLRVIFCSIYMLAKDPQVVHNGVFHGWSYLTIGVP